MLARVLDAYKKYFDKMRFLSTLASFLLSISAFFSLYNLFYIYFFDIYTKNLYWKFIQEDNLWLWIFFQITILVVFFFRFINLFYESKKAFKFGIILWLAGFSLILIYFYLSMPNQEDYKLITLPSGEIIKSYKYDFTPLPFKQSSYSFSLVLVLYMLLSPMKELFTLIFALEK